MKVSEQTWNEKMNNLNIRRSKEEIKNSVPGVDDYKSHISCAFLGKSVLDVGCGSMIIKNCLPPDVTYTGIDPFPMKEGVVNMQIEKCTFENESFDTVYCFAALDNVIDFKEAIKQIKRVCKHNVLFLTGINIVPDKFHTIEIKEEDLIEEMKPFKIGFKKYLHPYILLIEFLK